MVFNLYLWHESIGKSPEVYSAYSGMPSLYDSESKYTLPWKLSHRIVYKRYEENVCNFTVSQAYGGGREAIPFTTSDHF